ncbi:MAG: NTP transferase domain-containing protein [Bacteroidales bacterium]|nr:NTP transferase domain-containing protein [Bacteroidales bacterium]
MHYAIIAAGEGSRLRSEGVDIPKPLIPLNGKALIERLTDILFLHEPESLSIIVNEIYPELINWAQQFICPVPFHIVAKTTLSSMHSLYALRYRLNEKSFILTTVDTVFKQDEFKKYIDFIKENPSYDAVMAVTSFVEDEKPLWVKTTPDNTILSFDSQRNGHQFVSGGFYYFTPAVMKLLPDAIDSGMQKMRNFQSLLIDKGLNVKAFEFEKIIDIDHLDDLKSASDFIQK